MKITVRRVSPFTWRGEVRDGLLTCDVYARTRERAIRKARRLAVRREREAQWYADVEDVT